MKLLKTFLYFAVFKYPLTKEEAYKFCQYKTDNIDEELNSLLEKKLLYKIEEYYLPYNNPAWVKRRKNGTKMANESMPKAKRMANILRRFPFVRSIMISGTLAKGYMDEEADIDFFVITKPGNITISKAFMGAFRRIFSPRGLCVNFLIDSNNLHIEKQNVYTATELVTLIPLIDSNNLYDKFIESNKDWAIKSLPNAKTRENNSKEMKNSKIKILLESILSLKLVDKIELKLQQFYLKKLGHGKDLHEDSLKSGELSIKKGVFKGHNLAYQKTIIDIYTDNQKIVNSKEEFEPNNFFYD